MKPPDRLGAVAEHAFDPDELREWCDALDSVLETWGPRRGEERVRMILDALVEHARERNLSWRPDAVTHALNKVPIDAPANPDDLEKQRRKFIELISIALI
jgi:pyruvate dehydrogenase E1 component